MANYSNDVLQLFPSSFSAAVNVGAVTSMSHNLNNEVIAPESGDPFAEQQVLIGQQPVLDVTTESIAAVLGQVGLTGLCIAPDTGKPGLTGFLQKHDPCSSDARAATNHQSITFPNGHLVLGTLSSSRNSVASLSMSAHFKATDANPIPGISNSASLPTSPASVVEQFGQGKPTILGTVIHQVESVSVSFNPQLVKSNDSDTIYPTDIDPQFFGVQTQIIARSPELLGAGIPVGGQHTDGDSALRYIRRVTDESQVATASNGAFVDFTASQHLLGQLNGLVMVGQHYDASGRSTGLTQIDVYGRQAGSAPIVWDLTNPYDLTTVTPAA